MNKEQKAVAADTLEVRGLKTHFFT
ncbi:MAG: hypothetical protein FD137_2239, partial [Spirochaetes bacterium]